MSGLAVVCPCPFLRADCSVVRAISLGFGLEPASCNAPSGQTSALIPARKRSAPYVLGASDPDAPLSALPDRSGQNTLPRCRAAMEKATIAAPS